MMQRGAGLARVRALRRGDGNFGRGLGFFTRRAMRRAFVFSKLSLVRGVRHGTASEGRKAEDPFRGLRAGPASFPRPSPPISFFLRPLLGGVCLACFRRLFVGFPTFPSSLAGSFCANM